MSFAFDVDNEAIWEPGQRVGEVFVGFVEVLERVTKTPSGFSFKAADFIDIDVEVMTEFHSALAELLGTTRNVLLHEQVRPVLAIVTVLLRRGGSPPTNDPAEIRQGFGDYLDHIDRTVGFV